MSQAPRGMTDQQMDQIIGNLLRVGVLAAAVLTGAGGIVYLARHGGETADHRLFQGEPADLRSPVGVIREALAVRGRGLIQLGLLVLVATPVARVIFSVFAFLRQRDWTYAVVTLIVLAVLLYSLFSHDLG
jgi:uncharacterized membrane protein